MKPMAEQVSMFSPDSWSGKTSLGLLAPTEVRTSGQSWKKLAGLQNRPLLFLDMRGGDGQTLELLSETDGQSLGEHTIRDSGESHKGAEEFASLPISTDTQPRKYCLIVNYGEKPMSEKKSKLSEILEKDWDPKYLLSPKACLGILNRAARRGKELPKILEDALKRQSGRMDSEIAGTDNSTKKQAQLLTPAGGEQTA